MYGTGDPYHYSVLFVVRTPRCGVLYHEMSLSLVISGA